MVFIGIDNSCQLKPQKLDLDRIIKNDVKSAGRSAGSSARQCCNRFADTGGRSENGYAKVLGRTRFNL